MRGLRSGSFAVEVGAWVQMERWRELVVVADMVACGQQQVYVLNFVQVPAQVDLPWQTADATGPSHS